MKSFEFNSQGRSWDQYGAFHRVHGPFVEFETGELMVKPWEYTKPYSRRHYDKYGVAICATTDGHCPQLYLDKACTEPVKKAWVTQNGMQLIAVDYEQKVAFALGTPGYQEGKEVDNPRKRYSAKHLRDAHGLWTGPERLPVAFETVKVSQPDRKLRAHMLPKLDDVRAAASAIYRMMETKRTYYWGVSKFHAPARWEALSVAEIVAETSEGHRAETNMYAITKLGFDLPRRISEHEFLYVKGA